MRSYESNGVKLVSIHQEITGVLETLSKLNTNSLSPLRLKEWSVQKMVCIMCWQSCRC